MDFILLLNVGINVDDAQLNKQGLHSCTPGVLEVVDCARVCVCMCGPVNGAPGVGSGAALRGGVCLFKYLCVCLLFGSHAEFRGLASR